MTVEIRELVIRAIIEEDGADAPRTGTDQNADVRHEMIEECVEQVMYLLNEKSER